jgi:hypothetical protein
MRSWNIYFLKSLAWGSAVSQRQIWALTGTSLFHSPSVCPVCCVSGFLSRPLTVPLIPVVVLWAGSGIWILPASQSVHWYPCTSSFCLVLILRDWLFFQFITCQQTLLTFNLKTRKHPEPFIHSTNIYWVPIQCQTSRDTVVNKPGTITVQ